jgi:hypothetical protein
MARATFRTAAAIFLIAAELLTCPVLAASGDGPLAPGKPAGLDRAQISGNTVIFATAAMGLLVLGLYLASGTYNIPGQSSGGVSNPNTAGSTSTTTTTTAS